MLRIARPKPFSCADVHTFSTVHPEHSQFRAIVSFAEAFAEAFAENTVGATAAALPEAFTGAFLAAFAGAFAGSS
jgi:hypothetical protein